jgi:hypothetical protein
MFDCCEVSVFEAEAVSVCPVSRGKGKAVALQTVKALLTERALGRLSGAARIDPASAFRTD